MILQQLCVLFLLFSDALVHGQKLDQTTKRVHYDSFVPKGNEGVISFEDISVDTFGDGPDDLFHILVSNSWGELICSGTFARSKLNDVDCQYEVDSALNIGFNTFYITITMLEDISVPPMYFDYHFMYRGRGAAAADNMESKRMSKLKKVTGLIFAIATEQAIELAFSTTVPLNFESMLEQGRNDNNISSNLTTGYRSFPPSNSTRPPAFWSSWFRSSRKSRSNGNGVNTAIAIPHLGPTSSIPSNGASSTVSAPCTTTNAQRNLLLRRNWMYGVSAAAAAVGGLALSQVLRTDSYSGSSSDTSTSKSGENGKNGNLVLSHRLNHSPRSTLLRKPYVWGDWWCIPQQVGAHVAKKMSTWTSCRFHQS